MQLIAGMVWGTPRARRRTRSVHVSSTVVRQLLRTGQSVQYLVHDSILGYLETEKIWK